MQIAGFLGFGEDDANDEDKDTDPFTLQGSTEWAILRLAKPFTFKQPFYLGKWSLCTQNKIDEECISVYATEIMRGLAWWCRKQYSIDELQGSKIVRRRPGVTTRTCIKIASTAQAGGSGNVDAPEVNETLFAILWSWSGSYYLQESKSFEGQYLDQNLCRGGCAIHWHVPISMTSWMLYLCMMFHTYCLTCCALPAEIGLQICGG